MFEQSQQKLTWATTGFAATIVGYYFFIHRNQSRSIKVEGKLQCGCGEVCG
jgi:hypothetical protein